MDSRLVMSSVVRALLAACRGLGVNPDALLGESGIPRSRVDDPEARIPLVNVFRLACAALERSGRSDLPLLAAQACPFGDFGVLDYLLLYGDSVGEALRSVIRFSQVVNSASRLGIDEGDSTFTIWSQDPLFPAGEPRFVQEFFAAAFVSRGQLAWRIPFSLEYVAFTYPSPPQPEIDALSDFFGASLVFSARRTELALPRAFWHRKLDTSINVVFTALAERAQQLTRDLPPSDTLHHIRQAIAQGLSRGDCGLPEVARKLHMSVRTLQRRLVDYETTFSDEIDAVRRAHAVHLLRDSRLSLGEISCLLGYRSGSAFHRAFKRWMGVSPAAYRRDRG